MKLSDYVACDALELAKLISTRQVSRQEAMAAAFRAVEKVNPTINAVVEAWTDEPITSQSEPAAPLSGVPFLVKDLDVGIKDRRTELGSRLTAGFVARSDSYLMERFRKAGLLTIGRTSTPEFALSTTTEPVATGPTRNPWDVARSAGGSSGGAAAAVAAGIVPIAHATDGGGSIRVPASVNGLFGLKPTRGRVSSGPAVDEEWNGLGVQFIVSRTVRDSAAMLDCVQGGGIGEAYYIAPPHRPYLDEIHANLEKLKIGFLTQPWNGSRSNPTVALATRRLADDLAAQGHFIEETNLETGASWEAFVYATAELWTTNTTAWIDHLAAITGRAVDQTTLEPATLAVYEYGRLARVSDFIGALATRNQITRSVGQFFNTYDLLITPTLPDLPLPIGHYNKNERKLDGLGWVRHVMDQSPFTALFNLTGLPAMSVPVAQDAETDLPIGVQCVANFGREDLLIRVASRLERSSLWQRGEPCVWAGS